MGPIRVRIACQKCRSLKHKCDFKFPKCSRCERAKIDCMVQDLSTKELRRRETFDPKFNEPQSDVPKGPPYTSQVPWTQHEPAPSPDPTVWNPAFDSSGNLHTLPPPPPASAQPQPLSPSDSRYQPQRPMFNQNFGPSQMNQQIMQQQQLQQHPLGLLSAAAAPIGYLPNGQMSMPPPGFGAPYPPPHLVQHHPLSLPHMYPPPPIAFGNPVLPDNQAGSDKTSKFGLSTSQITALSFIPFKSTFSGPNNNKSSVNDISMFGGNHSSTKSSSLIIGTADQGPLVKLPAKSLTKEVILENYFNHAWIQFPIISFDKEDLEAKIDHIYDVMDHVELDSKFKESDVVSHLLKVLEGQVNPLDLFVVYILLAVGLGITADSTIGDLIKKGLAVDSPKRYFTTASYFLEKYFTSIPELVSIHSNNKLKCFNIQFKSLQCLLLISVFGLLEPISPGIWYIISVAMRLAVDMDLHQESVLQQLELDCMNSPCVNNRKVYRNMNEYDFQNEISPSSRHVHRQVFWSCYALERQISFYVNKPFNISDFDIISNIDAYLPSEDNPLLFPGYYIRGRKIQSIIQQIMILPASANKESTHPLLLLSGSLASFTTKVHTDLNKWVFDFIKLENSENPNIVSTFHNIKDFVFLNYFQLIQHLYKPSPQRSKPQQDDLEILAMASSRIILLYERLHKNKRINFKYLSVHFIHQSSMSFMYSLVNSKLLSLDPNTLKVTNLLMDKSFELIDYLKECCPPAANVGNTLKHMYHATRDLITKRQNESKGRTRSSIIITDLSSQLTGFVKLEGAQDTVTKDLVNFGFEITDDEFYLMKKYTCVPLKLNHLRRKANDNNSKSSEDLRSLKSVEITPSTSLNSINGLQGNDVDIDDFLKSIMTYEDLGFDFNALTKKQDNSYPSPMTFASPTLNSADATSKIPPFPSYTPRLHSHLLEPTFQSGIHSVSNLRQSTPDAVPSSSASPSATAAIMPQKSTGAVAGTPGSIPFKGDEIDTPQQSNGEFTDIQQVWEMLFEQPFNIKETMMNGGFSRVI